MTPEEMHDHAGLPVVPRLTWTDMRSVAPFCAECGQRVDRRRVRDGIGIMVNGAIRLMVLCKPCAHSLDAADYAETLARLAAIRAKIDP